RILTVRDPFSNGLYSEAGAMRLPSTHKLTQTYIEKLGLQTIPFTKGGPNSFLYLNEQRRLRHEVEVDPACLGFDLTGANGGITILQWWAKFIHDTGERVKVDEGYWDELNNRYDDYSFYDFFKSHGWSTDPITAFGLIEGVEPILTTAF